MLLSFGFQRLAWLPTILPSFIGTGWAKSPCYYPDGTNEPNDDMGPCNSTTEHSMCCNIRRTTSTNDVCHSNGVCSYGVDGREGLAFGREACTDPTWRSPYCLNLCVQNTPTERYQSATAYLTICTDGSWCCGTNNYTCCNNNQGIRLASVVGTALGNDTDRVVSGGSLPSPSDSSPEKVNKDNTTAENTNNSSSNAVTSSQLLKTGLAVGIPLGVIALGTAVAALFMWRRYKRLISEQEEERREKTEGWGPNGYQHTVEADATPKPTELMGERDNHTAEMPATKY